MSEQENEQVQGVPDERHVVAQTSGVPAEEPASGSPEVTGLTLQAHRLEDHGYWSFGVTLNGRYVELAACKLGLADPVSPSE